jgi:hypothetical protein
MLVIRLARVQESELTLDTQNVHLNSSEIYATWKERVDDEPNRAKARAGVPWASRLSMGRSGLCCFSESYVDRTNYL